MAKLTVKKAAAKTVARKQAAPPSLQEGERRRGGGSAPVRPTRRVSVKGKGLYVPNVRVEEFSIPGIDDLNVPSDSPFSYVWGFYAGKGWGKSSFANLFGLEEEEVWTVGVEKRPCFTMMTEMLRNGLEIRMRPIPQASLQDMRQGAYKDKYTPWEYCKGYMQAAIEDDSVSMLCIDSFDQFCQHALNHWCAREGVDSPTQKNDRGVLWNTIKTDVLSTLMEFKETGRGLILTAHEKRLPIDDPIRGEYYTMQPDISEWPYAIWKQVTDFVMYGVFSASGRSIFVRGNQFFHASCGAKRKFMYPDAEGTMYPIASFSAGNSEEEAYVNFLKAFRNELEPEYWFYDLADLAEKAAKKGKKAE